MINPPPLTQVINNYTNKGYLYCPFTFLLSLPKKGGEMWKKRKDSASVAVCYSLILLLWCVNEDFNYYIICVHTASILYPFNTCYEPFSFSLSFSIYLSFLLSLFHSLSFSISLSLFLSLFHSLSFSTSLFLLLPLFLLFCLYLSLFNSHGR